MIRFLATVIACCLMLSAPLAAEDLGKLEKGRFVTQAMLEEGAAPELKLQEVGTFKVLRIDPGKASGNCYVSLASLEDLIDSGHRDGSLKLELRSAVTIKLKTGECTDPAGTRVLCCKGSGSTCSVTVEPTGLY